MKTNKRFIFSIVLTFIFIFVFQVSDNINAVNRLDKKHYAETVIFCFHDVNGKGKYSITKTQMEDIFNYLKTRYEVYSLETWKNKIANGSKFTKPPVVLTYDDGYPSIRKIVVPMLKRFNYGATLFVYLERYKTRSKFFTYLKNVPEFIEIGSHSLKHSDLKREYSKSMKAFYKEVYISRKKLEYVLGKKVTSWAWPYGSYDKKLVKLATRAGYTTQVSTDYKNANYYKQEILSRYTIQQPNPVKQVISILSKNYQHRP